MGKKKKLWHEKDEFEAAARMSNDVLRHSGALARVPPNLVTLAGGALVLPMFWAYLEGFILFGTLLFTVSQLTDWIDGALARYQKREHEAGRLDLKASRREWLRLGPTELGKKLDPVIDKCRYFAALLPLGWNLLPHVLIWCALAFAASLTFFREVVRWLWGLKPGANAVGKYKVYVEIGVIACLVFRALWAPLGIPALVLFIAATALGGGSLFTQAQSIRRQVKEVIEEEDLHGLPLLPQARVIREHIKNREP